MTNTTKTILITGAIILALTVTVLAVTPKEKLKSLLPNSIIPKSDDHKRFQTEITRLLTGDWLEYWNARKTGGAHGVPGNSKTIKPMIFDQAKKNMGWSVDTFDSYDYPGLIVNESTNDGLGRDPNTSHESSVNWGGAASGAASGAAVGGVYGAVAGFVIGIFS